MQLKNPALFKQQNYLNGQWVGNKDQAVFEVFNPFDGKLLGVIPKMSQPEVKQAIDASKAALAEWSHKTAQARSQILTRWANLIAANKSDLARIMTLEQGKPLAEAETEIDYGNAFIYWFAEEGKRIYGDVIPSPHPDRRLFVIKQPIGVCTAITPWNFPMAMITRKAAPVLAAGCTIIIKPAEATPYSALALAVLAEEAGIPAGVFNVITGDAAAIGREFCQNPAVSKLSFTGSTRVGKVLLEQSSSTLKKLSLELGGNAPFIVFEDADIDAAVEGLMLAKFRNAGQACVSANRVYVHEKVLATFIQKLQPQVQALKVGNGLDTGVSIGPLINADALNKVSSLVTDAVTHGAKIICGGNKDATFTNAYCPTIITNIPTKARLIQEEIFGPVLAIFPFRDEADVIIEANNTRYGLAAYFYSRDVGKVWRVAEALDYGMVSINQGVFSTEVAPFGGVKESGFGREGSKYGLEDYVKIKYVCLGL